MSLPQATTEVRTLADSVGVQILQISLNPTIRNSTSRHRERFEFVSLSKMTWIMKSTLLSAFSTYHAVFSKLKITSLSIITCDPLEMFSGVCICRDPDLCLYFLLILLCLQCFCHDFRMRLSNQLIYCIFTYSNCQIQNGMLLSLWGQSDVEW